MYRHSRFIKFLKKIVGSLSTKTMEDNVLQSEEKQSLSPGKSLSASHIIESHISSAAPPINQVDENHYVYRKGSTQVHVQTYPASSAGDIMNETETKSNILKGIKFFSALFALTMVVITLVIKLTGAITDQISDTKEDEYMLALYAAGFVWITYYNLRGTCKYQSEIKFLKSNQSSNRWLKGVIILFGLAIILKSGLEFLTFVTINTSNCFSNQIEASRVFFHGLFVISQVTYLIRFSKVYIWNFSTGSRIGLMYIISVNLSTWIAGIVDETLIALEDGNTSVEDTVTSYSTISYDSNETLYQEAESSHGEEECECHSTFCSTVHTAETFLFPFVIEFSLVASCMLYFTWSNIGKYPPSCERVIKPSYKFYGKYTGASSGGVAFFLTIVFLILLGTSGTSTDESEEDFFNKSVQLLLYDGFSMGFETIMLLVTLVGFYLFYKINRPLEKSPMLDQVLLVVCLLGPLTENIFSMVAIIIGNDNRSTTWIFTFLHPLVDVLQCFLQLMFIMYGLKREPVTSTDAKETEAEIRFRMKEQSRGLDSNGETSSEDDRGHINMNYLRSRQNSITSIVSRLANVQPDPTAGLHPQSFSNAENGFVEDNKDDTTAVKNESTSFSKPVILVSEPEDEAVNLNERDQQQSENPAKSSDLFNENERPPKHNFLKIVSEIKVARPDKLRFWLRDVIFFLLVANASLWIFQSLSGTAFSVDQYESIFYGASGWTTITMICRPLIIFFRMHSAGCLFEMWSFA